MQSYSQELFQPEPNCILFSAPDYLFSKVFFIKENYFDQKIDSKMMGQEYKAEK